uniref:Uncharacterized protein n=1 Tax=Setaria digitata TaxID=48799 RepID=A0A915PH27_9BILA
MRMERREGRGAPVAGSLGGLSYRGLPVLCSFWKRREEKEEDTVVIRAVRPTANQVEEENGRRRTSEGFERASMAQKTYQGTAMLDVARSVVELILKQRVRDASARGDRYMLMSFEEFPMNVKKTLKREKEEGEAPKDIIKNGAQFLHFK